MNLKEEALKLTIKSFVKSPIITDNNPAKYLCEDFLTPQYVNTLLTIYL